MIKTSVLFIIISASIHGEIKGTISGGLNISSSIREKSDLSKISPKYGYHFGVGIENKFIPLFSFSLGFGIETRGDKTNLMGNAIKENNSYLYLQVPFQAIYYIPKKIFEIMIFAGPDFGYGIKRKLEVEAKGLVTNNDLMRTFKRFDIGISIGTGIQLPLSNFDIYLAPSYYHGFLPTFEVESPYGVLYGHRHRNFKISIGIKRGL